MPTTAAVLALLVGVAGWYYLFYSQAARRLEALEDPAANAKRSRFRRVNSVVLLFLAAGFYAGFVLEPSLHPLVFLLIWLAVIILLTVAVALAVVDLRLTGRIRRKP